MYTIIYDSMLKGNQWNTVWAGYGKGIMSSKLLELKVNHSIKPLIKT